MNERDALEAEILARARVLAATEAPGGTAVPLGMVSGVPLGVMPGVAPASASGGFAVAREMFLGIFVSQALDQMAGALDSNKEFIAAMAAEYATRGVEALEASISRGKVALGMPPVPGLPGAAGPPPAGRLPW